MRDCYKNFAGVLRAKGFFWVAADHRVAYEFAQAGGGIERQPCGYLVGCIKSEALDIPEESRPDNQPDWHEHYGDRKQMLVFIGQDMDETAIRGMLDNCLLSSPLAEADFTEWEGRENYFHPLSFLLETQPWEMSEFIHFYKSIRLIVQNNVREDKTQLFYFELAHEIPKYGT